MDLSSQASAVILEATAASHRPQCAVSPSEAERRAFDGRTAGCAAGCAAAWTEAEHAPHEFGAAVCRAEKLAREHRADQGLEEIERVLRQWPASPAKRAVWRQGLLHALRRMARDCLACDVDGLDRLFTTEAMEATRQFLREARAFAPEITDTSLFQALRNLWVVHSVQLFLRAPIALSPAIFAYSMLYPWTDNCLDEPRLAPAAKIAFGNWLTLRLTGVPAAAPDGHCEQVGSLVSMIERLYPRAEFPEVYLSLQAIHRAQMQSLDQQDARRTWDEPALLALTIPKGGASVLTDAWLVRGWLTDDEAQFMFAYGVLLQLMDDLQDFRDDLAKGHTTLFTRQATLGPLDGVTARLWAFTRQVLWSYSGSVLAQGSSLNGLIQDNLRLLLLQTVARNRAFYTSDFVSELEDSSPVRFCYLARQEKGLAARYSKLRASMRQNQRVNSVFEMLV
jgi:hypothetical protein